MKRIVRISAILSAALLLHPGLTAFSAGELLILQEPEQMPDAVGTLRVVTDRDMNGSRFRLYRLQDEGTFLYYAYTIDLCEDLTTQMAIPGGDYRFVVTIPSDLSFEWLDYTMELSIPDPEAYEEQAFTTVDYTIRLDTDAHITDDLDDSPTPVIEAQTYRAERSVQFARADFVLGDLDGDGTADAADAAQILISSAALGAGTDPGLYSLQMVQGDLNGDGAYDSVDAADLLTYAAAAAAGDFTGDALSYVRSAENATAPAENES